MSGATRGSWMTSSSSRGARRNCGACSMKSDGILRRGVDFAGYRIFRARLLPRKRNVKAARRRFRRLSRAFRRGEICVEDTRPSVMSFLGYMRHAKAERTTRSTLRYLTLRKE